MRKFLLVVLFIVLVIALVYKSPFSALYNYNKARALYDNGKFEESLPYFERSLFADKNGILARFFYVLALSKSEPVYTVQKKLYQMATSKINDEATAYAKAQAMALRYKLLEGIENNYIYNAPMSGDIVRWDINSFPLKVYFEDMNSVPEFYIEEIRRAMKTWADNTNFVKFEEVSDLSGANIIIKFKKSENLKCDRSICEYSVAYTEPKIDKNNLLKQMVLTFYRTNPKNEGFTPKEIFNTALHEFGHTLGIMGHSDYPGDVMYSMQDDFDSIYNIYRTSDQALSMRDLKTLVLLYRLEPTISNVANLHSENFYYTPLVLGDNNVLLYRKLNEYRKYILQYPSLPSGYINIASVYGDLGDSKSALAALDKAESLVKNQDDLYLIMYNRAIIYYNSQNYEQAMQFAIKAKAIDNNKNINDLISDINKLEK